MANNLDNFSIYLWKNPEGYHVTTTINYQQANELRAFFSFGKQTYKSWRAFNLYQPDELVNFFAEFKAKHKKNVQDYANQYWISKLAVNTGTRGRATGAGSMILFESNNEYGFVLQLKEQEFKGIFDDSNLSAKQRKGAKGICLGEFKWRDDDKPAYVDIF
jgi:hypothetical protein